MFNDDLKADSFYSPASMYGGLNSGVLATSAMQNHLTSPYDYASGINLNPFATQIETQTRLNGLESPWSVSNNNLRTTIQNPSYLSEQLQRLSGITQIVSPVSGHLFSANPVLVSPNVAITTFSAAHERAHSMMEFAKVDAICIAPSDLRIGSFQAGTVISSEPVLTTITAAPFSHNAFDSRVGWVTSFERIQSPLYTVSSLAKADQRFDSLLKEFKPTGSPFSVDEYVDDIIRHSHLILYDSQFVVQAIRNTSLSLSFGISKDTDDGLQVLFENQSRCQQKVKALHPPVELIPDSLHPNKIAL